MTRILHMCQDIRGALRNYNKRQLGRMFRDDKGKRVDGDTAREYLLDQIAMGRKVLPLGEPCEGFSYETGCPGHEEKP